MFNVEARRRTKEESLGVNTDHGQHLRIPGGDRDSLPEDVRGEDW